MMHSPRLPRSCPNINFNNLYCKIFLAFVLILITGQLIWTYQGLGEHFVQNLRSLRPSLTLESPSLVNGIPNFHRYGKDKCFSPLSYADLMDRAGKMSKSCRHHTPAEQPKKTYSVGTVTALFGGVQSEAFTRALQTHQVFSLVQADPLHVLCSPIVDGMWNKQQFLLSIIVEELLKPKSERLDWLFWADADTMVLDQCRHLSDFLPPKDKVSRGPGTKIADDIHLVAAKDWNGLNAGVFFIRVSEWSIGLLNGVNSFRLYNPEAKLTFAEQSAMTELFERDEFKHNVTFVPQYWFNTYPHPERSYADNGNLAQLEGHQGRRGDFMVHFPGDGSRGEKMMRWSKWLEEEGNVWETGRVERNIFQEVKDFWDKELGK